MTDPPVASGHDSGSTVAVELRPAVEDDLLALADIEVAAGQRFREVGLDIVADDPPPPLEEYRDAAEDGLLWVAVAGHAPDGQDVGGRDASGRDATGRDAAGSTPVGYAWAMDLSGQPHLEQLTVDPDWQRRGIGTALLDVVVEWVRSTGAGSLTLSTFRDVPWNGPWYADRGFAVLPESAYGERFDALRRHEAAQGLTVAPRVVMVRPVLPS